MGVAYLCRPPEKWEVCDSGRKKSGWTTSLFSGGAIATIRPGKGTGNFRRLVSWFTITIILLSEREKKPSLDAHPVSTSAGLGRLCSLTEMPFPDFKTLTALGD